MKRGAMLAVIVLVVATVAGCASRYSLGRSRPDLAALVSADDGLFGFAQTYTTGTVGPFQIGDTRSATVGRLRGIRLFPHDQAQVQTNSPSWRLSIPAKSGGYAVYTLRFENERVVSARAYYSVFSGL